MILIFTHSAHDVTVLRLSSILRAQGVAPVIIDPTVIEGMSALTIRTEPSGAVRCQLRLPDQTIDLADVRTAWLWRSWRRYDDEPALRDLVTRPQEWSFYKQEWLTFYRGLVLLLAHHGVYCVNPPPFNAAFEEKCCQLFLAARVGLAIPATLYTTRVALAREFAETHHGGIIYKPFRNYAHVVEPTANMPARASILYTTRVPTADLVESPQDILTPSIFQPYVEKAFELRVVVVGRQIFACAIYSQQSERSREDWRRYDLENTPYLPYDLPPPIAEKLLALMDHMGLVFGCIDMIVTPEGHYVFLEVNPNGQFDWVAQLAGLPIYDALAALLIAGGPPRQSPASTEVPHGP